MIPGVDDATEVVQGLDLDDHLPVSTGRRDDGGERGVIG